MVKARPTDSEKLKYKVKHNQVLMMKARGYSVKDSDLNQTNEDKFTKIYSKVDPEDETKALVFYSKDPRQVSKKTISTFCAYAAGFDEAILITKQDINQAGLDNIDMPLIGVQVFSYRELSYNPTLSVNVPTHEVLNSDETRKLMKEMGVDYTKLPLIKASDPQIKYYNYKSGMIVRILADYTWLGTGKTIEYRLIVG